VKFFLSSEFVAEEISFLSVTAAKLKNFKIKRKKTMKEK